MHQVFGVDVEDRVLMRARSWRWLRVRILGLFDVPPRGFVEVADQGKARLQPVWVTRLQAELADRG